MHPSTCGALLTPGTVQCNDLIKSRGGRRETQIALLSEHRSHVDPTSLKRSDGARVPLNERKVRPRLMQLDRQARFSPRAGHIVGSGTKDDQISRQRTSLVDTDSLSFVPNTKSIVNAGGVGRATELLAMFLHYLSPDPVPASLLHRATCQLTRWLPDGQKCTKSARELGISDNFLTMLFNADEQQEAIQHGLQNGTILRCEHEERLCYTSSARRPQFQDGESDSVWYVRVITFVAFVTPRNAPTWTS